MIVGNCWKCLLACFFGQIMDKVGAKFALLFVFDCFSNCCLYSIRLLTQVRAILIGGAAVGFFCNGMNAGYGAIVGNLYPSHIRATANNIIFNIGRAVGGFSSVFIGFFLDNYSFDYCHAIFVKQFYILCHYCLYYH